MTHLNELCSKLCLFDASNPVEKKNACDLCHMSNVNLIIPAIKAIDAWGQTGEIIGESPKEYYFRTIMSNGEPSVWTLNKSKVKKI